MTHRTDELRAAAQKLRTARFTGAMTTTPAGAALVCARNPLANWLDSAAVDAEQIGPDPHALATARAINAGAQP